MIKVCGITRRQDADVAVEAGADTLGFIFAPESPRRVTPAAAREIIATLPSTVLPVGVFVNAGREAIVRVVQEAGIRAVQMHGDETPEDVLGIPVPVIKAHRVSPGFSPGHLTPWDVYAHLLDAYVPDVRGGTGRTFDWHAALRAKPYGRIIVSGGLTPENVGLAVRTAHPFGVDASSRLEVSPGIKNAQAVAAFVHEARRCLGDIHEAPRASQKP